MKLSQLHESILDAYTVESFRRFLAFELDKDIDDISRGGDFRTVVFDVLQDAQHDGWIDRLLDAIISDKPKNPKVRELSSSNDGDLMNDDRQTKLVQDIAYLNNAIFGIPGMDGTGIAKQLRAIERKVDSINNTILIGRMVLPLLFIVDMCLLAYVVLSRG